MHQFRSISIIMARSTSMLFGVTIIFQVLVTVYSIQSTLVRITANGPIRGIEQTSALGQKYYSFRGIPFAAPPIAGVDPYTGQTVDRRFKSPEPLEYVWKEPLKAYNYSKVCMQQFITGLLAAPADEKSEDCLYLNIFEPVGGARKKTVIVSIHGGSFLVGDGRDTLYGPDFLLSQDNVVVTIQHRLGMFGFLNLGFCPYTGNMGLKDQQMALKWVYTNIGYFSGRNDQILLFGQSAGAASVHYQMLNPKSRQYFQRAYALSGVALVFSVKWRENHLPQAYALSNTTNPAELIQYLKTANASVLAECYALSSTTLFRTIWVPTYECSSVPDAFITKTPEEIYKSNEAPVMDTMFSLTTTETLGMDYKYYLLNDPKEILNENWKEFSTQLPCTCNFQSNFPNGYQKELALLNASYYSDVNNHEVFKLENLQFVSDFIFGYPIVKSTILQTQANYKAACAGDGGPKKTFLFRFDVHAALNAVVALTGMNYTGATHVDDFCYCFYCRALDRLKVYDKVLELKDKNYDFIMRSVKMITNFARTGNLPLDTNTFGSKRFYFIAMNCDLHLRIFSDPSIDANTCLVPSNPNQIYHAEVSNATKTLVKTDIKEQIHYDTWTRVERIFGAFDCYAGSN